MGKIITSLSFLNLGENLSGKTKLFISIGSGLPGLTITLSTLTIFLSIINPSLS